MSMQNLTRAIRAHNLCSERKLARWPESSLSSKVAQGCGLLPVDRAGETVGVVSEVTDAEKTEETESKEHWTKTGHDKRWKTHHTLGTMCDHVWVRSEKNARMRAYGEVLSVHASGGNTHWTELSNRKRLHDTEIEQIAQADTCVL